MRFTRNTLSGLGLGLGLALASALALGAPPAAAQGFSSGSSGADGALGFPPDAGTIVFDPTSVTPRLDPENDGVYHFTTIAVPAGTTVRLSAAVLGQGRPVVWLASGAVTVDGTIDVNGAPGHASNAAFLPADPGAGGYSGGAGGTSIKLAAGGNGPGGAPRGMSAHGGGAGHVTAGGGVVANTGAPGQPYGNDFIQPLVGGSGGAGGSASGSSHPGTGGGGGGGAFLLASSISIRVGGAIAANGGTGGPIPAGSPGGGGGAGSGGAIRLIAPTISGAGSVTANGGAPIPFGVNFGGAGRIRLEALSLTLQSVSPAPSVASPGLVFLPATAPALKVLRVGGVAVTASPTGSFVTADVMIAAAAPVAVEVAGSNIPPGTIVRLILDPETGNPVTVDATLAGTFESSTATAQASFPHGFTRLFVRASWQP